MCEIENPFTWSTLTQHEEVTDKTKTIMAILQLFLLCSVALANGIAQLRVSDTAVILENGFAYAMFDLLHPSISVLKVWGFK